MPKLVVATSNPGKLKEMQEYLSATSWELVLKPPELEIPETGTTFRDNARLKASSVAKATGEWAIADDSGLAVAALKGAPGLYSARYGQTDAERITRLLTELGDHPNRRAQFICALAMAAPEGDIIYEAMGICEGEITTEPVGDYGFGYDPIFYIPEYQQTFAQMSPRLKQKVSHRGLAFAELLSQLSTSDDNSTENS